MQTNCEQWILLVADCFCNVVEGSAADGSPEQKEALAIIDYSEKIQKVIDGLAGEKFHALHLAETYTNHDHEEIVESIEVYKLRCVRHI